MRTEEVPLLVVEPLWPEAALGNFDLNAVDERRGGRDLPLLRETGVRLGRPIAYPLPPAGLPPALRARADGAGHRYYGLMLAFDLDELPGGRRYAAAELGVRVDDERIVAVDVNPDGDALGLVVGDGTIGAASAPAALALRAGTGTRAPVLARLLSRTGVPRPRVRGLLSPRFGWRYEYPDTATVVPDTYAVHAILEVPRDVTELTGTLIAGATVVRSLFGHASHRDATAEIRFAAPLPTSTVDGVAAVRLCMAADLRGYSTLTNDMQERAQRRLVEVLAAARARAGLTESEVDIQEQGDGQFAVLPVGIDETRVIPGLVAGLDRALRAVNADLSERARIRLRVALHRGSVKRAASGWVGDAAVAVHRILDCAAVRAVLTEDSTVDCVLAVPDVLYRDVVAQDYGDLPAASFTAAHAEVPAKGFTEHIWVRALPGR